MIGGDKVAPRAVDNFNPLMVGRHAPTMKRVPILDFLVRWIDLSDRRSDPGMDPSDRGSEQSAGIGTCVREGRNCFRH